MAAVAAGPASSALARPHHPIRDRDRDRDRVVRTAKADPAANERAGEYQAAGEADNDAVQQAAACQKAGIDPNGANVQYDGQTGTCSVDSGNTQQQRQ